MDLGAVARRPRGADPPGLAPSPERALPAPADQGRLSDGGGRGEVIWARCAKALGHPEWCEDPRFATNRARMANRDALEDVMNTVLTTKTTTFDTVLDAFDSLDYRANLPGNRRGKMATPVKRRSFR